jgi:cobalt-zinc-cadmium efflux system protein
MIVFAVFGVCINFAAAFFTRKGASLNQKAVNLHMLEDVLGWIVVLIGAILMKFTDIFVIDSVMSVGVAVFIAANAIWGLKEALDLFLEKTPKDIDIHEIKEHLSHIEGIIDVHHIHIWSMDGNSNYGTMHIVTMCDHHKIKEAVREELREHGIVHVTLEIESDGEECHDEHCHVEFKSHSGHHHHHH